MKQVLGQVEGSSDVVIIGADLNSDHLEPEPPDSRKSASPRRFAVLTSR